MFVLRQRQILDLSQPRHVKRMISTVSNLKNAFMDRSYLNTCLNRNPCSCFKYIPGSQHTPGDQRSFSPQCSGQVREAFKKSVTADYILHP